VGWMGGGGWGGGGGAGVSVEGGGERPGSGECQVTQGCSRSWRFDHRKKPVLIGTVTDQFIVICVL